MSGRTRSGSLRTALALSLIAGLLLPGEVEAQSDRPEVTAISFEGNRAFSDHALAAAIVNRASRCRFWFVQPFCWAGSKTFVDQQFLVPRQLPLDILRLERFYGERGYRSARVDTLTEGGGEGVRITFLIEEGEPVRIDSIGFVGVESIEVDGLTEGLSLSTGQPLSVIQVDEARNTLITRLRDNGYAHAEVLIDQFIPAGERVALVDFIVDPGPVVRFGEVSVLDNRVLDQTSLRRMLPFSRGNLYRRRQLVEGQRNLYSLDIIQYANVSDTAMMSLDTVAPITVRVREGDVHRVRSSVGWSTSDCLNSEALWSSRNFFGGARRLQIRARISNILASDLNQNICPQTGSGEFADLNGQLSFDLVQPWIFSPRNSLGISAFIERQSLPEVFIREAIGLNIALSRSIARGASLTLSFEPQLARLEAAEVFFCSSFRACTEEDIDLFRASNWLSPLGLGMTLDRTDGIFNPTRGYLANISLEHASSLTTSDFAYNRLTGSASTYRGAGGGSILALRIGGGIVGDGEFVRLDRENRSGLIHPEKRLYSGGASSVRGFAENRLGPRILSTEAQRLLSSPAPGQAAPCTPEALFDATCDASSAPDDIFTTRPTGGSRLLEGNVELRIPVDGGQFQLVGFVDAGQVWAEGEAIRLDDLEVTPGVGIRYFSPIGPIRVDLGVRPNDQVTLPLISSGIRPWDPASDPESARLSVRGPDGMVQPIDWVPTRDLIFLDSPVPFGQSTGFLNRLQLHISIGQAF